MNEYDSNRIYDSVSKLGFVKTKNQSNADFQKSKKKNILKCSATIQDLYLALEFLTCSKSVTGHICLLDGGAHLAPPLRDVALK